MRIRGAETAPGVGSPQPRGGMSLWVRDFHLYAGLFISPFVLVFAVSVFPLVHPMLRMRTTDAALECSVSDLPLPADLNQLSGRVRIDALRPALDRAGVHGEAGWIQHEPKENRLVIPISLPGRLTTVTIDVAKREALVREQATGLFGALIELHKSPGPHLVDIRGNWYGARAWSWFADATVYLLVLVTLSGVYVWWLLRRERKVGLVLLIGGVLSLFSLVYALVS